MILIKLRYEFLENFKNNIYGKNGFLINLRYSFEKERKEIIYREIVIAIDIILKVLERFIYILDSTIRIVALTFQIVIMSFVLLLLLPCIPISWLCTMVDDEYK